ncbi:hypothetical protein H4R20_003828 [Coemansia guatemalensis]|uniref:Protein YOP1 n=1 Tax=Coemansia guatemalensis TaxID=2761395 RepID=A0A9W8I122_9FUNG|nr:hypothetical protein H4R20_003828 [Coemansia guatemalensis]
MAEEAAAFLEAVERLPRERYPATHGLCAALSRLRKPFEKRLPPHLHPLLLRFQALCVRQTLSLETRVHINPTFQLLLSTRIIPPSVAFLAAAASTAYVLRYLYINALDLLTNLVGVAYPAYQSIMCIEYGELPRELRCSSACGAASGLSLDRTLGFDEPNLDKKQWLMYWSIFGLLTTADHWAGPILRMFPMYRLAKIGVLIWAQHRKYNGAAWLYDTFVRPLLPPPPPSTLAQDSSSSAQKRLYTDRGQPNDGQSEHLDEDSRDEAVDDSRASRVTFSSLAIPSVWESTIAATSAVHQSTHSR